MKKVLLTILIAFGLAATLGSTPVFAQKTPEIHPASARSTYNHWHGYGPLHTYLIQAFAEKTGLSVDQVNAQLATGKTLAQIALDQGVKQEDLSTFLLEVHKLALDKAVAAGVITRQQADWMYQRLLSNGFGFGCGSGFLHTYLLQAFAEKTGLSVDQVNAQLATGKTLAQIALEQGVKQEDLSTFLLEVHKLALDKAVAAGVITRQQADQIEQAWVTPGWRWGMPSPGFGHWGFPYYGWGKPGWKGGRGR